MLHTGPSQKKSPFFPPGRPGLTPQPGPPACTQLAPPCPPAPALRHPANWHTMQVRKAANFENTAHTAAP